MNAALDPAVSRFTARLEEAEEETELWRGKVQAFRNLYGFLSQVIPYQDSDLERLYVFLRHLAAKLPRRRRGPAYQFDDDVRLEYYRLQKIADDGLRMAAAVNPDDKFKLVFRNLLEHLFADRMDQNEEIFIRFMNDPAFQNVDPETGARYTVKRYESEKTRDGDSWRHAAISLKPLNPAFEPIVLTGADEDQVDVIAEFVDVVGSA